jgi:hypothetical protein
MSGGKLVSIHSIDFPTEGLRSFEAWAQRLCGALHDPCDRSHHPVRRIGHAVRAGFAEELGQAACADPRDTCRRSRGRWSASLTAAGRIATVALKPTEPVSGNGPPTPAHRERRSFWTNATRACATKTILHHQHQGSVTEDAPRIFGVSIPSMDMTTSDCIPDLLEGRAMREAASTQALRLTSSTLDAAFHDMTCPIIVFSNDTYIEATVKLVGLTPSPRLISRF